MADEAGVAKPHSDEDKIHLFLAYFGIFALIPFLMFKDKRSDPQKEYVYWHARQGLALALVELAAFFVVGILCVILAFFTLGFGAILFPCLGLLMSILCLLPSIFGWMKAFAGEKWEMPLISTIAEMFK